MCTRTWNYYGLMSQGTDPFVWTDSVTIVQQQSGGYFVPATCPMKFNKLNSVRHDSWTKYPPKLVLHNYKTISTHKGTWSWDATRPWYTSPQCTLHKCFVAVTSPCNISPRVCPPFLFRKGNKEAESCAILWLIYLDHKWCQDVEISNTKYILENLDI